MVFVRFADPAAGRREAGLSPAPRRCLRLGPAVCRLPETR